VRQNEIIEEPPKVQPVRESIERFCKGHAVWTLDALWE
jgi:hypothetical protein